jgi:hypothetical protein
MVLLVDIVAVAVAIAIAVVWSLMKKYFNFIDVSIAWTDVGVL